MDTRYNGISNLNVVFKKNEQGYEFSADVAGKNLKLSRGKSLGKATLTINAHGNKETLDIDNVVLKSSLINATGTAKLTGIKDPRKAHIDLNLKSNEFSYEDMVDALPTVQFPGWLKELLTVNIRGGRSQVKFLSYQGTLDETTDWRTCLKNLQVSMSINGQSFGVSQGLRATGVTGLFSIEKGTIELKDLTGIMNASRIRLVNVTFPDIVSHGFRVAVTVDANMPVSDFVSTWRACVVPPKVRRLLDPINTVEAGRIKGIVWVYYQDITDTAVIKGNVTLTDVSMFWGKTRLRHFTGKASARKYGDPVTIQLAGTLNDTAIDTLEINLKEPLKHQFFTFALKAHGFPASDSFGLDKQASVQMTGSGKWPNLAGNMTFIAQEINLFNHHLMSKHGQITGTCTIKAGFAPQTWLEIPDLAVNLNPDVLHSQISRRGSQANIKVTGKVDMANLQAAEGDPLIPKDGNIIGELSIAADEDVHITGTLDFRQAGFTYKDKPLTVNGLITLTGDKITSEALKIRHDQMTLDMNGTLTLDKIPHLKGDLVVDRLTISAGAKSELDMLKKLQGNVKLKLTNLNYNGISIQKGSALAELGPAGLKLTNLELSDKTGAVNGNVILNSDGRFEYNLDMDLQNVPVANFITATWPTTPPWMDGQMDLQGRVWGHNDSMNGDVSFKAHTGNIQRYNFLSRIFSVLNPYKIIMTGEFDFLHSGFPYNTITATFTIRDSVVTFNDFYLNSNSLQISAVGKYLIRTHYIDTIMGIEPLQTFDKTINQIPIVGWVLTGEKGTFIVINLHVLGPVDDTSVTSMSAGALTKSVAESLLRILKLPLDLITKPGEVILPGALKENGNKQP
ncbi:MAG: AsmA-like C-terminal domain-containing protein [Deltaproteobacteria bacterium]|nr:AsmA-like C-terminal domain-containing protein [Deltaproteobacteria bacterium]